MAAITKAVTPSIVNPVPCDAHRITGLKAGEALAAGDACYIKSDGKVWKSTGAAANAAAKVRGYAATKVDVGEPITLYEGLTWAYASGLTPGIDVFLSGTVAGGLDTVASTGGTAPIGYTEDAGNIRLFRSAY